MMKRWRMAGGALVAACLMMAGSARGWLISDEEPAMTWDDLLKCKLVVVGKYDSHNDKGVMGLKVERVLRSPEGKDAVKVGDVVNVQLQHWWSVETGATGWGVPVDGKGDGKIRLCYKEQIDNPGPLVPVPVLESTESAVFFFTERGAVLKRPGQVLSAVHADGWQQALDGKAMDLEFRLGQGVSDKLRTEAVAELKKGRDAKVIGKLIEAVGKSPWDDSSNRIFQGMEPQMILVDLGDKEGDVYDAVHKVLEGTPKEKTRWQWYRLAEILASVDSARAMKEFKEWIKNPPAVKELRGAAISALGWVGTEEALNLAIDMIGDKDGEVEMTALFAVRNMIAGPSSPGPVHSAELRTKLRAVAKKRLAGTQPPASLGKDAREMYEWMVGKELEGEVK